MPKIIFCIFVCTIFSMVRLESIEVWGEMQNVRAVDYRNMATGWFFLKVQNRTLKFPLVSTFYSVLIILNPSALIISKKNSRRVNTSSQSRLYNMLIFTKVL